MEEVSTQTWNKKRIFIAVFLLLLLTIGGYFFKIHVLDKSSSQLAESVKGISVEDKNTESDLKTNIQEAVKEKLNNLKQEASNLDVLEIASSSPQVQKIINDIKALEQYPVNQVQEICKKICGL